MRQSSINPATGDGNFAEHILQRIDRTYDGTIVDMGTGSGAILAALCFALPSSSGVGIDQCQRALL